LAKDHGVKVQAWQCDVGDAELVKKTFKEIDEKMGPIQGLVFYHFDPDNLSFRLRELS